MDTTEMKQALDLCTLIRNVLRNEKTDTAQMDLAEIHRMAKKQTLTAITYMALEQSEATAALPRELDSRWRTERDKAVRKNLLLKAARTEILSRFENAGIWYLPLKGSVLAEMYPKTGMRQMADNDILFDKRFRKDVRNIMEGLGYKTKLYGRSNHDIYLRQPIYNFEMHTELFTGRFLHARIRTIYYRDIEARLLPDGGMRRKLKPEDFYIYFLTHGYKHLSGSGDGIRFLMDCHVFLSQCGSMDWDYLSRELKKLSLEDFEPKIRSLSQKLFATGEALTDADRDLLLFCTNSNTYGSSEIKIQNTLRRIQPEGEFTSPTLLRYFLSRIWPDQEWYEVVAPFVAKYWMLKPFYLVWRIFRGILFRRKRIIKEIKTVLKTE